jgi:hypothetical protein
MVSTYKNQLTFIKPQVSGDIIVGASTWVDINTGQQTTLTDSTGVFSFSTPVAEPPPPTTAFQAINKTEAPQALGVGFDTGKQFPPATALFFNPVPVNYNLTAEFTPTLTAYVVTNYQKNQILRGAIQSPPIWSQNLAGLDATTSWTFAKDSTTGDFTLTQDQSGLTVHSPTVKKLDNVKIIPERGAVHRK